MEILGLQAKAARKHKKTTDSNHNKHVSDDYIVENYIDGEVYHIDGLVSNNRAILISPAKYHSNCLDYVNGNNLGSYTLMSNNKYYDPLYKFAEYLVTNVYHMPIHSLFHIEVFIDKNDKITLCEIACRLGGNNLSKEIELAYGVDINLLFLELVYNKSNQSIISNKPKSCGGRYLIPPKCGILKKDINLPKHDSIIDSFSLGCKEKQYNQMEMSNSELVKFILKEDCEDKMVSLMGQLADWGENNIHWAKDM
ncbi:ATP-grasp domain-containing protein [Francisella sp. XLW-1]|uniref:ATP-grasp domain-containing protein n=1 Tax=Francisella sp. XLW-1 TaxID=2610887 RepID=UPI00123CDFD4|nr:ATP-grasp domain-containing protein [Francisella sp. XLW-1]